MSELVSELVSEQPVDELSAWWHEGGVTCGLSQYQMDLNMMLSRFLTGLQSLRYLTARLFEKDEMRALCISRNRWNEDDADW